METPTKIDMRPWQNLTLDIHRREKAGGDGIYSEKKQNTPAWFKMFSAGAIQFNFS
jgi:hypothetical protein